MDIDGPQPTAFSSRSSTSTSAPRPSSAGVQLPGIRTLPGFQINQHESGSGSGLGSSSSRGRDWISVREREAMRDRDALREMDRERQQEREQEGLRGYGSGIGSGTGGGLGYDVYSSARTSLGKERELSLPMSTPVSRPLPISSSSAMAMSMTPTDHRPRSRGYTSSATLNSILSVPAPPEPFSHAQPRPHSSASRSLSSPSPFAHGAGGSGLPPIGHGLLATARRRTGGVSEDTGTTGGAGGGASGGRWPVTAHSMSPTLASARTPTVATSSASSSSLAHLYAAASASGSYSASTSISASRAPTTLTSRPSSSHASTSASVHGMNGYGHGRNRADSAASANTSTSGSMTPTSHHRMPVPLSPPMSASSASSSRHISHPRPQAFVAPPPPHRALMSPPPFPESRRYGTPTGHLPRVMSPPAPASTPVSTRGNVNPYLAARMSPSVDSPYAHSPQLDSLRIDVISPPPPIPSSVALRPETHSVQVSLQLGPTARHAEEISRVHAPSDDMAVREWEVMAARERETQRRSALEEPTTKEALRMDVDIEMEETSEKARPSLSSRTERMLSSPATVSSSLELPTSTTPSMQHETLRPPSSSPLPHLPSSSPPTAQPSSPANRVPSSPGAAGTTLSHSHPHAHPSPSRPGVQEALILLPDTLIPDDSIRCICGISIDDGFSIACDVCSRWCHTACFKIEQESVPEEWVCWVCATTSPNPSNGHATGGGGGRGKGRGKGKATATGAASKQWTPWTKEEVEERRVWARAMQMERLGLAEAPGGGWVRAGGGADSGGMMAPPTDVPGPGGKRKRRSSALPPFQPHQQDVASASTLAHDGPVGLSVEGGSSAGAASVGVADGIAEALAEDEDPEPWTSTYVSITQDVITDPETRVRLRRHAQRWRGVSALTEDGDDRMDVDGDGLAGTEGLSQRPVRVESIPDPDAPNVTVRPLVPLTRSGSALPMDDAEPSTSAPNPNASASTPVLPPSSSHTLASASFAYNPLVLPPSYSLHTTSPIPSKTLIAPFVSHITPSSTYLADPLNAYVHLGMPKPYVHLLGPPLEVALDARGVGGKARFARRGCWPNAVVRPVLCEKGKAAPSRKGKERSTDEDSEEEDGTQLAFGVFALRDLKAGEEVVLGWEWDDGHVIHKLPALLQTPSVISPTQSPHIKDQMANLLHALASNFVACACGARVQLGEGCTGRHDRHDEQFADQPHRQYENDYYYNAESGPDIPYHQHETEEDAPRGRTRERVSVREKRMRQKEKQQSCALASMARFVGQDDLSHEPPRLRSRRNHNEEREDIDLGPLVGASAKRGIRTREGRFGGVESVYSVHGRLERGRIRGNGEMNRGEGSEDWSLYGGKGLVDSFGRQGPRNDRHASPRQSMAVEEPRPPDPRLRRPVRLPKPANGISDTESKMPPKMRMRKRWTRMHAQGDAPPHEQANVSAQNRIPAPIPEAGSTDADDDTALRANENGRIGLGIRLEGQQIPVSIPTLVRGPSPQPTPPTSPLVDANRSLKLTPTMSQVLMPPPPLPIPRDSSTAALTVPVSGLVLGAEWSNNILRSPPRSPGSPIVVSSPSLPRRTSTSSDGSQASGLTPPPPSFALSALSPGSLATSASTNSPSPLVSFANLSLLSPAILSQVRMHVHNQNTARTLAQPTPDHSPLLSLPHTSSNASYFPVQATSSAGELTYPSHLHAPPEPSPSSVSVNEMDLNRGTSASPDQGTKDDKVWSPLQRRPADSLVRMSESRRSPDTSEPRDAVLLSPPTESSLEPHQISDDEPADETELAVPSKGLKAIESCENGIRVEYPLPPEPSANRATCAEATRERSVSLEEVDGTIPLTRANSTPRSQTPTHAVAEVTPMDVEVETAQSSDPVSARVQLKAETDLQSDEAEDIEFPSHRWRRKRKRIVSMDSEAAGRSQSPPYKVARDSEVLGVDVHTSPRPQRERSVPSPFTLARGGVVDEDAAMQDAQGGPAERDRYTTLVQVVPPAQVTSSGPPRSPPLDAQDSEPMVLDDATPLSVKDTSPTEPTATLLQPAPVALVPPVTSAVPGPEPSPQPEAPRKVKLSLADFARRKKQQRQEEERQLELQRAFNPPAPSASPPLPEVSAVVTEPPSAAKNTAEQAMDTDKLPPEPRRQSTPVAELSSPKPQSQVSGMINDVPMLDTARVKPPVKEIAQKDPSPAPSPMSVSPEDTAPPPIKFVLATPAEPSPLASVHVPSPPTPAEPLPSTPFSHSLPTAVSASKAPSSPPSPSSTPTQAPQASDQLERQAKQERIEAVIPPLPSAKPSRFGPPLTRPLVGLVVHPPPGKPNAPAHTPGRLGPPDQRAASNHLYEKIILPPHVRRHSQAQEDGEIRENVPPTSPMSAPQSTRPTWFGKPLPDPPQDPKDLKGWNQYYREVYNLTGSFDPPGVAVRPGAHPPPKGPRSLNNLKGEPVGNLNGNMGSQAASLATVASSRSSLPIPTGPRYGVRPGARAPIPDDATRAALAKAKAHVETPALPPPISAPVHPQSPLMPPGPPPLSARIGPPIPRGTSVDHGDRDGREDGERRGGRDYRPYARGRGRGGGGAWRK